MRYLPQINPNFLSLIWHCDHSAIKRIDTLCSCWINNRLRMHRHGREMVFEWLATQTKLVYFFVYCKPLLTNIHKTYFSISNPVLQGLPFGVYHKMHIWLCIASLFHIVFHISAMRLFLQRWLCIRPKTCNCQYSKLFGHRMNELKKLLICPLSICKLRVFSGSLSVQHM
jgi:hypothetical protein